MRHAYRISTERRIRDASLTAADFHRTIRMVHRIESEVRKDRRCICLNLGCAVKTGLSFCHVHRSEDEVRVSIDRLRARIESVALDRPPIGSAPFVLQVALEERERMALEDAKELDIIIEATEDRHQPLRRMRRQAAAA